MTEPNPYAPPIDERRLAEDDHRARGYANVALGIAIASFLFCGPLLGVVAIFFAWRALRLHPSSVTAKLAIGLSIVISVGWLAIWQFLDSQAPPPRARPSATPSAVSSHPGG